MRKEKITIFLFLIILAGTALASAQCEEPYSNEAEVGDSTYCVDADGFTASDINPSTTPPTIRQGASLTDISEFSEGGNFQTVGEITLASGDRITGQGTVNGDGSISIAPEQGTITTRNNRVLDGNVTYNPDTGSMDLGSRGGAIDGKTFYNANSVTVTVDGTITGTAGDDCVLPNALVVPEGETFTITPRENYNEMEISGCIPENPCQVSLVDPSIATDTTPYRFTADQASGHINLDTAQGSLDLTAGAMECDYTGECYIPENEGAFINGVVIPPTSTKVDLHVSQGTNFDTSQDSSYSVHFHKFSEGRRGINVKNTREQAPRLDAYIAEPGLYGFEQGDELRLSAMDGSVNMQEREGTFPAVRVNGNAGLKNDAYYVEARDGKIYGRPLDGGNAVAASLSFFSSNGTRITTSEGDSYFMDFANVNANNTNLFNTNLEYVGPGENAYVSSEAGACTPSQETGGQAFAFITGMASEDPSCGIVDSIVSLVYETENYREYKAAQLYSSATTGGQLEGYFDANFNGQRDGEDINLKGIIYNPETEESYYVEDYYVYQNGEPVHRVFDSQGNVVGEFRGVDERGVYYDGEYEITTAQGVFSGEVYDYLNYGRRRGTDDDLYWDGNFEEVDGEFRQTETWRWDDSSYEYGDSFSRSYAYTMPTEELLEVQEQAGIYDPEVLSRIGEMFYDYDTNLQIANNGLENFNPSEGTGEIHFVEEGIFDFWGRQWLCTVTITEGTYEKETTYSCD